VGKRECLVDQPFNVTGALGKYPKILDYSRLHGGLDCVAFEKHDGTNLAWRWDGTDFAWPVFRSGRSIIEEQMSFRDLLPTYGPVILAAKSVVLNLACEEAVFFTEFRGEKSFSGEHVPGDEKTIHPIDLWIKGKGFMPPAEFAKTFNIVPIYHGKLITKFVDDVRKGRMGVNEGVVCKGGDWGSVWCCKIKTDAWLAKGGEA
jgi:hypothetical protein